MNEGDRQDTAAQLRGLRARADEDFDGPPGIKLPGRHQIDIPELGLRVAVTRARYPNRDDGVDQYAVTLTRSRLDQPPADSEVSLVLETAFGASARDAVERTGGGPLVRMFRVPADPAQPR
ncbi:MAG: hypothetical protein M3019_02840 [Candidatus Dormibacteraeota bacterium]|nr:hypothetical protein [Candidatus Dormibacteraeota bacterium]